MSSKVPPTDTISRCYQQQQGNRKLIRILTVVVYVLCVSLAAIMLSLYYIFIWDPTIRPFITKSGQCEKIIIPEKIAIRLLNSSEVTAEQFYRHILEQYRILYQLQIQRQQFLQKQHIQLQQLAAGNRFQEIFATATIIQASANERIKKPLTPSNGTFLLEAPLSIQQQEQVNEQQRQQQLQLIGQLPILDVQQTNINTQGKRKSHRKHYNNNNNNNNHSNNNNNISSNSIHHTHRRNSHKNHNNNNNNDNKMSIDKMAVNSESKIYNNNNNNNNNHNNMHEKADNAFLRPALNEPILLVEDNTPGTIMAEAYTPIPIPLILNSSEDNNNNNNDNNNNNKRRSYGERRVNMAVGKRRTTTPTYMNPLLTGELIFEK